MRENRIFVVPLMLDDDSCPIGDCILEARRICDVLKVAGVSFRYDDGVLYTVCADGRVIQTITSTVSDLLPQVGEKKGGE
tara:strand:+ start:1159 stop:1398 length:240 start_codon:yes stop_codon:yes gene_type:complete